MDTSEQYIKMCDCPEIQGQRSKEGIEVACWVTRYLYISKSFDYWIMVKAPHVWLPRQDQLQEMWSATVEPWFGVMLAFISWFEAINPDLYQSMEQLWLAFYMCKRHGKAWENEKWIKK